MLLVLQLLNLLSGGGSPPVTTTVPDVVGNSQATAISAITTASLVAASSNAYSAVVTAGNVISQSPAAGSTVNVGTTVTIVVSLGVSPGIPAARRIRSTIRRGRPFGYMYGR